MHAGLKSSKLTDIVLPSSGPTAGVIDEDADVLAGDKDGASETRDDDELITDEEDSEQEMEEDTTANSAMV